MSNQKSFRLIESMVILLGLFHSATALVVPNTSKGIGPNQNKDNVVTDDTVRRDFLRFGISSVLGLTTATSLTSPSLAFDNKISTQYDDRPKRRGSKVCS